MSRSAVTLLIVLLAAVGSAGCGGDNESSSTPKAPELTVPGETTGSDTSTTKTETAPTTTQAPSGTEGQGGGTQSPPRTSPQDSPTHDIPPQPGTPESRFEKFCRENPGACG